MTAKNDRASLTAVLTDHQLRLMEVLWQHGHGTVAEVVEHLPPPPLAYSTVLTTLRALEQKGYLVHDKDGRAYVYRPVIARDDAAKSAMRHLLYRFFGSSPVAFALKLLDESQINAADVAAINRLLSARSRKGSKGRRFGA